MTIRLEKRRIRAFCAHCRLPIEDGTMATETFGGTVETYHGQCIIKSMNAKRPNDGGGASAYHPATAPIRAQDERDGGLPSTVPPGARRRP